MTGMIRSASSISLILVLLGGCPGPDPGSSGDDEVSPPPPPPACLTDDDCADPAEPLCDGGSCVACVVHADCSDSPSPLCDNGECVDCIASSDCPDPDLPMCTNGTCVAPCTIDAQEPNDAYALATAVDDFQFVTGSLCPGDEDWFAFTIAAATYVGISARYDGRHGDLDLELRGPEGGGTPGPGEVVAAANGTNHDYYTAEAIYQQLLLPGTYALRVYLDSGHGGVAYQIRVDLLIDD